ncbi:Putative UBA-like superfamily, Ubiquitin-associated domain-containing protein [Septoria linicola]|uniref:UBA-like superfamily, Ubiquitin-associated domain-containing protein n=1 Tax=Septoria linicola TaxID=215465 RepID=A0A9Q9EFQ9_9PEZI|nr:putative UBA-like superfamily, Ubiquitin-associated domain-containing protein [Septoria linicola]USW48149.1 Putative UBA-like superfamily, Ubiquitin-associated domain-containing protein [Septoria linicola]
MAPEHPPSDAIGFDATDYGQAHKTSFIARRSVSIFSRRGTEDQEPKPVSIAHTVMRPMTARQNSWIGKRSSRSRSSSKERNRTSSTKGTVLNAVPAARVIKMTSLEEEMATSPNEEILSAISEHAPSLLPAFPIHQCGTTKNHGNLRSRETFPSKTTSRSRRRSDNDHRIGTWINGVAHFDWCAVEDGTTEEIPRSQPAARQTMHRTSSKMYAPEGHHSSMQDLHARKVVSSTPPPILLQHPVPKRSHTPTQYEPASTTGNPYCMYTETSSPLPVIQDVRLLTPEPRAPNHPRVVSHRSHPSQSSSSSRSTTDQSSIYSRRSSMTTIDTIVTPDCQRLKSPSKFSLLSPTQAGVFDDISPRSSVSMVGRYNVNKTLPPTPVATPTPPATQAVEEAPTPGPYNSKSLRVVQGTSGSRASLLTCRSMNELRPSAQTWYRPGAASPTLSQAENAVRTQLSSMAGQRSSWQSVDDQTNEQYLLNQAMKRKDSVREVMQPPERAPTLPKRSRKREWRDQKKAQLSAQQGTAQQVPTRRRSETQLVREESAKPDVPLRKMASVSYGHDTTTKLAALPHQPSHQVATNADISYPMHFDVARGNEDIEACSPTSSDGDSALALASANSAEAVLLRILGSLQSLDDLFSTAIINRGMYRVYKEHEMHLIQTVIRNQSPAAYEYREWRNSEHDPNVKYTPRSYLACHRRDVAVIERLKRLVHEKCQSFLRRETLFALSTPMHPNAQRIDDAFWRICCFCAMFSPGNQKGREDDVTGQLDWLKGGLLDENQGCAATVNTNLEFDMSSVLLNAPEHFAIANKGGLTTAQLWDLTEIWNCYSVLLSGYSGRVQQAREYGVFDNCDITEGDIENEERLLEEWLTYALTLGPHAVLELALLASDNSPAGFALAKQNGWTEWTLPIYSNSLCNFLKEPVAITYSEQVIAAKLRSQDPQAQQQKELSRKRVASMAAEIRLRRQSSEYKRLPLIDMHAERAMSVVSRRDSAASLRSGVTTSSSQTRSSRSSNSSSSTTPAFLSSYRTPLQSISPIPEGRSEYAESVASSQSYASGIAENTSEIATMKLVAMGFPVTAARQALRITDDGESLRVDRAVEYLLRQNWSHV